MRKILIIEDDNTIANSINNSLRTWGFDSYVVSDFKNVVNEFITLQPHLVLMDISLPFFNGYHWCNEIRKISKVPIIFLSSSSDNMNVVMAVNMGGDDFISKPFSMEILVAKIQSMLRRTYDFSNDINILEANGATLNTNDTTLLYQDSKIELTKNEYRILEVLLENKGKVISRDILMTKLWETDSYVDDNTLTVNVTRLRKKLDSYGLSNFIKTKKGLGYLVN